MVTPGMYSLLPVPKWVSRRTPWEAVWMASRAGRGPLAWAHMASSATSDPYLSCHAASMRVATGWGTLLP
jgi:hypothetical protein